MRKSRVFLTMTCFVLGCFLLTGCSKDKGSDFEKKIYTPAETELSGININVRDRELAVSLSDDDRIHIEYFENDKEFYNISVDDDNVLTMTAANDKEPGDYIGTKTPAENRRISLQLPDNMLKTLVLSTTNEDITLSALTVTDAISLSANGGDITFEQLDAGNSIRLDNKNGDINGTITGGYDDYAITCRIKKGESNLPSEKEGGAKTLDVSNNNGDIDINFIRE